MDDLSLTRQLITGPQETAGSFEWGYRNNIAFYSPFSVIATTFSPGMLQLCQSGPPAALACKEVGRQHSATIALKTLLPLLQSLCKTLVGHSNGPSFVQKIHQVFYDDFLLEFLLLCGFVFNLSSPEGMSVCWGVHLHMNWMMLSPGICRWNFAQVDS